MNMQNVINVCLTICVTLLVFQNQQLKNLVENISSKPIGAVDALSIRIDKVEADLLSYYGAQSKDTTLQDLRKLVSSIQKLDAAQNKEIAILTGSMKRLSKPISVEAIKKIIEKCKVPNYSAGGSSATWNHGHKSLEC